MCMCVCGKVTMQQIFVALTLCAMLCSFLFDTREVDFEEFVMTMDNMILELSPEVVVSYIHGQKKEELHLPPDSPTTIPVLLLVDEITKAPGPVKVVSAVCGMLSAFPDARKFMAVISTLEGAVPRGIQRTASERPIQWIPMRLLQQDDVDGLFANVYKDGPPAAIQRIIRDAAGHARTLEKLYALCGESADVARLYQDYCLRIGVFSPAKHFDVEVIFEVVKYVLRGKEVTWEREIADGVTVDQLVSWGVLNNTPVQEDEAVVPLMTPLGLYAATDRLVDSVYPQYQSVAALLRRVLGADASVEGWPAFEEMHLWWEALMRSIDPKEETILEFYTRRGRFWKVDKPEWNKEDEATREAVNLTMPAAPIPSVATDTTKIVTDEFSPPFRKPQEPTLTIVKGKAGQPGCDVVVMWPKGDGKVVAGAYSVECKHSLEESSTQVNKQRDIKQKMEEWTKEMKATGKREWDVRSGRSNPSECFAYLP